MGVFLLRRGITKNSRNCSGTKYFLIFKVSQWPILEMLKIALVIKHERNQRNNKIKNVTNFEFPHLSLIWLVNVIICCGCWPNILMDIWHNSNRHNSYQDKSVWLLVHKLDVTANYFSLQQPLGHGIVTISNCIRLKLSKAASGSVL